jgi:hypothetical protein
LSADGEWLVSPAKGTPLVVTPVKWKAARSQR